jgi:predicted ester cyclase
VLREGIRVSGSEVGRGGRRTVELFYNELWDARRLELLDELIVPNVRFRSSLGTVINGREAFGRYIDTVLRAFPDWRHSIDEMFVVEDRVITRMTWTGTHEGPLGEVAPTGARVEYVGAAFFKVTDGAIHEGWVVGDTQEVWRALGKL